ncbi:MULTISPECIES: chromosome partition protein MukE [Glaesserella]|uniref:Chromosome partition protein MukE n=1 Tax=Glaesserella australis TaxID=2094024 RepID=A0A328C0A8_9PAST|nr:MULTISPECIES: chromosome partition protein MukE [Glaesserella]AUI65542.1 chromosome partition protein MukE [Glaesserella sp. 15-184]RAL19739.1 chromosome partition protein MukE [Glaesserella australis]
MTDTQHLISTKLAEAIANPIFPQLDSQLRSGRHISLESLDEHAFLMDYQGELEQFYRRYHVELIRAPEGFFYLRPKASTLIARSAMSEMEMLVGKVLCYLYLSPERLAQQGIFHYDEVYDELLNLADESKLLKAINPRSTGSDLDKAKLAEKVGGALRRLGRLGMITRVGDQNSKKFVISESVFRFGADVRAGDDPREAQLRLIRDGEATSSVVLKEQAVSFDEEFANDDELNGEEE